MRNRGLKDDIRDYWSIRAETYDLSPGHGAMPPAEAAAWLALIRGHLGPGAGRKALDPGCGTGTMSLLLHRAGFRVTGLDLTEPMLDRARRKAAEDGAPIAFLPGDAEATMEPDATHDAILARNLFWTLPAPEAALRDWFRILRPGGRLMIVDGDFARASWIERLAPLLDRLFGKLADGHSLMTAEQWREHHRIMAQLPHGKGLRDRDVAGLLARAGFTAIRREGLGPVLTARHPRRLSRAAWVARSQHRFVVSGMKPQRESAT